MNQYNDIQSLLFAWGHAQHQAPPNNSELKNKILANFNPAEQPAYHHQKTFYIPWLSLALGGLAVLMLVASPATFNKQTNTSSGPIMGSLSGGGGAYKSETREAPAMQGGTSFAPLANTLPPADSGIPSTDDREFLRTDYSARIQTRKVGELTGRIQTAVRGFGGRTDSSSSGEKFGYISFVVPASKFDAFRQEIKSQVGERFIVEQTQTENMLPQKRSIEEQQKNINQTLAELNAEKDRLMQNHNKTAASLQSQINSATKQLNSLQNQQPDTLEEAIQIEAKKKELASKIQSLRASLAGENKRYQEQLSYLDMRIQGAQKNLENAKDQDQNLLDTVATVRGTISLNWINLWELINLYVPNFWLPALLIAAAIAAYFLRRPSQLIIP